MKTMTKDKVVTTVQDRYVAEMRAKGWVEVKPKPDSDKSGGK